MAVSNLFLSKTKLILPSIVLMISDANDSVNLFIIGYSSNLSIDVDVDNDNDVNDDVSHMFIANAIKFTKR